MRLDGKVAIVTGGGRGIGRGIARMFAKEGARLVIAARTREQLDRVQGEIEADGGAAASIVTDVSKTDDLERMVDVAVERFGRLDILVNNAGIGWWGYEIDGEGVEESYDQLMAINLRSVFMGSHFAVPHMKKIGGGSIINIASVHAWATMRMGSAYAASKGGMVAGTRGLALELAPHFIRVNVISPGAIHVGDFPKFIEERFGPAYRDEFLERFADVFEKRKKTQQALPIVGMPEDIAYCALYLASDESRFVTGANITVDGGMTAQLGQGFEKLPPELEAREREMQEWLAKLREIGKND
ncbi:MAG: glucose 1-dehydrogenase [Phycisphaerae bacterium]|nr:glucose 1-dehydrogenase [Phycisphaerae bacterium]